MAYVLELPKYTCVQCGAKATYAVYNNRNALTYYACKRHVAQRAAGLTKQERGPGVS